MGASLRAGSSGYVWHDTGTGIAAEVVFHVFERFYRADSSGQQDGSSGLG